MKPPRTTTFSGSTLPLESLACGPFSILLGGPHSFPERSDDEFAGLTFRSVEPLSLPNARLTQMPRIWSPRSASPAISIRFRRRPAEPVIDDLQDGALLLSYQKLTPKSNLSCGT